jgi:urea transport system substrate-binding protein
MSAQLLSFPPFRLDPLNQELWRAKESIALRPKTFAVLSYLVRHPQRLVMKQELLRNVWADVVVSDDLLRGYVRELRVTLGDNASAPRYVATVPRRGYKFLPRVTESDGGEKDDDGIASRPEITPLLLGTDTELAKLLGWLRRARCGERKFVFIADSPSAPQPKLFDLLLNHVRLRRGAAATGRCAAAFDAEAPCQPIVDGLRSLCRNAGGERVAALLRQHAPSWLSPLGLSSRAAQGRGVGSHAEALLLQLVHTVEAIAAEKLLVLAIEDLQHADPYTLHFIAKLAHRAPPAKLFVVATYRPDEVAGGESGVLCKLLRGLRYRGSCEELATSWCETPIRHDPVARTTVASRPPFRVGILHSLTGRMARSEMPVVDATLFAIEEINARGGILGRPIEAIVSDGQSDEQAFAREAERLIAERKVGTLFGCWTSASRKTVRSVVERHDRLLFYPVQFEGMEQSPNIVYTGAAPNQQILPAVRWAFGFLRRRRYFLVGCDTVFCWAANAMIRDEVRALGGEVVGEAYIQPEGGNGTEIARQIAQAEPDVILNSLGGELMILFSCALRAAGVTPRLIPTMYFSVNELELLSLSPSDCAGDYGAWNYFQSIDRAENKAFVSRFRSRYGGKRVLADPMEASYVGIHLWARAVAAAGSDDAGAVRHALSDQIFDAPEGRVQIDPESQYAWKTTRLGKVVAGGQFEVMWSSERPVRPEPFASSRSPASWNDFLSNLYRRWDGHWTAGVR